MKHGKSMQPNSLTLRTLGSVLKLIAVMAIALVSKLKTLKSFASSSLRLDRYERPHLTATPKPTASGHNKEGTMETLKIAEWKLEGVGYCTDCGAADGPTYRQPWRGAVLCESCWLIDTAPEEKEEAS